MSLNECCFGFLCFLCHVHAFLYHFGSSMHLTQPCTCLVLIALPVHVQPESRCFVTGCPLMELAGVFQAVAAFWQDEHYGFWYLVNGNPNPPVMLERIKKAVDFLVAT